MSKFLEKVVQHLKSQAIPLENWVIILPSQRAAQYLQKELFLAYQQPILAPKITTIHRWIQEMVDKTIVDKVRLLIQLHAVHTKTVVSNSDEASFDEFFKWGQILLSDFDEIERYLVDYKQLLKNLKDIKEIENWSFDSEQLSVSQQKFMAFWEKLPHYYTEFNKVLQNNNILTNGMAYQAIANDIELVLKKNQGKKFLFAGFNALSPAETLIFKQLYNLGKADILLDADIYYLKDDLHEAGMFMRKLMADLEVKELPFTENKLATAPKKIELIACAQATGQAKVAGTILEQLDEKTIQETLILLADESLIVPLIKNLPKKIGTANITLGLPLRNSALKTWVELIFKIQEGIIKQQRVVAYHKDLLNLWNHPFFLAILSDDEYKEIQEQERIIRKNNTIYQNPSKLNVSSKIVNLTSLIYTNWNNDWSVGIEQIRILNRTIYVDLKPVYEFEKAIIENFDKAIIDFQNCINEEFPSMKLRTFKQLFHQQWSNQSIAYYGNPIDGLQIMGLLETRLLDFKTILILGLNENNLPPTNPIQTLIPMDLRRYFGMPTAREKQGLFAHHFYRLLHHCENLHITYRASSDSISSNEKSRYIMQLELELARQNQQVEIVHKDYTIDNESTNTSTISIEKTPEVLQAVDQLLARGISASAIKTYFTCNLDFYYKYLLKFGEEEKVEEKIENNTFGTFIHEVLEDLYRPFARRTINGELVQPQPPSLQVEDVEKMEKGFEIELQKKFSEHFNDNPAAYEKGKNFLSYEMAKELLKKYFKAEKIFLTNLNNRPFFIESLEHSFVKELTISIHGQEKNITLKGFADRIDSIDGEIRIVDYKTGKVSADDVSGNISANNDTDENIVDELYKSSKNKKHFFQLLTYAYLYHDQFKIYPKYSTIIPFINISEGQKSLDMKELSMESAVKLYPKVLQKILEEIYSEDEPITHTANNFMNYCTYCV